MLLFYIVLSLFAVFGFFCAVRLFTELIFASEQIAIAIEVRNRNDAEMLDMLLHEAVSAFLRRGRSHIVVLLSAELMDGTVGEGEDLLPRYQDLLDRYGAECYLID